jgi:protein-S-isoprenylcysteine O-methyltransferase Ste14
MIEKPKVRRGERFGAIAGSTLFFIVAPGTVAWLIPWAITGGVVETPIETWTEIVGAVLAGCGSMLLLECFGRFAVQGLGTPAPIAPTKHLVVTGAYRFVRNPMYLAVAAVIFGQALLFGSLTLAIYGVIVWCFTAIFVMAYEEPTLRRTYGEEYQTYCANVGPWLPRLTPWMGVKT